MEKGNHLDWVFRAQEIDGGDQRYRDQWGDEWRWTSMLPLAWSNIDIENLTIRPRAGQFKYDEPYTHAIAQWSMALHLLGLGMGWNNIGAGLRNWARYEFREGYHPILDFLKRTFGDEIRALEVYFGVSPRVQILEALDAIRLGIPESFDGWTFDESLMFEYEIEVMDWVRSADPSEPTLASLLLSGGDALHLEDHCAASFRDPLRDLMGAERRIRNGNFVQIWTHLYGGWAHRLAATSHEFKDADFLGEGHITVQVEIEKIGVIGNFIWSKESSRWFRYSEGYGVPSLQYEAHLWGK
jgi:hypothetical protein